MGTILGTFVGDINDIQHLIKCKTSNKALNSDADKTPRPLAWSINDKLEAAEERAAFMEYDGGLHRAQAKKYAIQEHLKPFFLNALMVVTYS